MKHTRAFTDAELLAAYSVALTLAHEAPKSISGQFSSAWSTHGAEVSRLGAELDRRGLPSPQYPAKQSEDA